MLAVIGKELAALPQSLAIEGHTDAAPFGRDRAYTNWELSAERANAARRIMEESGLPAAHVKVARRRWGRRTLTPMRVTSAASARDLRLINRCAPCQ